LYVLFRHIHFYSITPPRKNQTIVSFSRFPFFAEKKGFREKRKPFSIISA